MALSDLAIRNLAPKSARYEVLDGDGLYVRVMPTGSKSWVYRYMVDGKAKRMTLGQYPGVSATEARKKAATAKEERQRGIDPVEEKLHQDDVKRQAPDFNFMLEEFWEKELKSSPSGKERRRLIEKDAVPVLGEKKVASITRRDVVLLIDKVRDRAPVAANRLQGALVRLFNFAAERGVIDFSPLVGLRKKSEAPRQRVLSHDEIKLFWNMTDAENMAMDAFLLTKLALRIVFLTGQRPGEVAGMTWGEIKGDEWNIPAGRRKKKIAQSVPLCPLALNILEEARLLSSDSNYVFQSPQGEADRPTERLSLSRAVSRHLEACGFQERWTPHDLRRTVRTGLAELGIDDMVAEQVLGHKIPGIMGVYNQHSYDKEKRAALEKWERHIRRIVGLEIEEGKVIPIRRAV